MNAIAASVEDTAMMMTSGRSPRAVPAGSPARPRAFQAVSVLLSLLIAAALSGVVVPSAARPAEPSESGPSLQARIEALIPEIETYVATSSRLLCVRTIEHVGLR
jgi:hypothetical protein